MMQLGVPSGTPYAYLCICIQKLRYRSKDLYRALRLQSTPYEQDAIFDFIKNAF